MKLEDENLYDQMYRENGEELARRSTQGAITWLLRNDFGEAPNWGNLTTKQVLIDLYKRIAKLEENHDHNRHE